MITSKFWSTLEDGQAIDLISLESAVGAVVEISNFGGLIRSLTIPMPDGTMRQTVLNYKTLDEYLTDNFYIGATIGPYANRIRGGKFSIDGIQYQLDQNEGDNTLHGGSAGFHAMCFDYEIEDNSLLLKGHSPDGTAGFPGNIDVTIRFRWKTPTALEITYTAVTDRPTILNMTNHSYFNLGTEDSVLSHKLYLRADSYTPIDVELLPSGEIASVKNTPFDFRVLRPIAGAYDHNFVLSPDDGKPAATLCAPGGELAIDVFTDKPGLQIYTGTMLGVPFTPFAGLCLETQIFPDAPNIEAFPSALVLPEKPYHSTTVFAFRV